ncbi:MAG: hypothetical protein NZ523_01415 [Elioraea sp.]|nr:hypothetical protein [Elioraea sp.]
MSARDVAAGLACAVLMARGRAEGLRLLDGSPATAWRSFLAMLVASPLYLALKVVSAPPLPRGVDPLRLVAAEAIGYVLGWFATALVMLAVARVLDREGRWPLFVAAWNWSNVVQLVVFLAGAVVASRLPAVLAGGVTFAALGYVLWLQWFVAREAFAIPGPRAAAVVGVDLVLGLFLSGLTLSIGTAR